MAWTRRRVAVAVVALLVVGVAAAVALGALGAPSVVGVDNRFAGVNASTTVVESDLRVRNPNPFGAAAGVTLAYAVEMNGVRMAEGRRRGVSIAPGTSTVQFTTLLANDRIPDWWVTHVANGESTELTVLADVRTGAGTFGAPKVTRSIETDLLSAFNSSEPRDVNAGLPVVSDPVVVVEETSAQWGTVSGETTPIRLAFAVRNPKPYPVGVSRLEYDVTMNGVAVGNGSTDSAVVIPPGETRTIRTTARIDNSRIDDWWVTHLERDQVTTFRIDFAARLDLRSTTVRVPLEPLTYTETIETDLFGTKDAAPTGDGEATVDGATASPNGPGTETRAVLDGPGTGRDDGPGAGRDDGPGEPGTVPASRLSKRVL